MSCHGAGRERLEQVVVGAVVAEAHHEGARRSLPVREEALDVDTLVHPARPHLDHAMPEEHLGGKARELQRQVVQKLVGAPGSVLRLGLAVVPGDGRGLALDERAGNLGCDPPQ